MIFLLFLLPVSTCFSFLFWGKLTSSTDLPDLYWSLITSVLPAHILQYAGKAVKLRVAQVTTGRYGKMDMWIKRLISLLWIFSLLIFSSSWTAQKVTQGHTLRTLILDLRCNKREKGRIQHHGNCHRFIMTHSFGLLMFQIHGQRFQLE